jgi:leukemia factor-related protein
MARNPDNGSVLALPNAGDEVMESFKWHQPPSASAASSLDGAHHQAAAALVSLTPVVPTSSSSPAASALLQPSSGRQQHSNSSSSSSHPNSNNVDVISLQYMELEEFLLENAVAVVQPNQQMVEQKVYPMSEDHHHQEQQQQQHHHQQHPGHQHPHGGLVHLSSEKQYQIMSNGSELKREEDMDPSLHRPSLSLTPPEHQNDVIMNRLHQRSMGRTLSGPSEHTSTTATSTILTPTGSTVTMRRTTSLCEPMSHHDASYHHLNAQSPLAVNTEHNHETGSVADGDDNSCNLALSPSSSSTTSSMSSDAGGHVTATRTRGGSVASSRRSGSSAMSANGGVTRQGTSRRLKKEPVPDNSKDDKYWKRRAKNNLAAKRSRDLRREKENAILGRVQYLEGQNQILNQSMADYKQENIELKDRLARYEAL